MLLEDLDTAVRLLEKPLGAGDYAGQHEPLRRMLTALQQLQLPNLEALELRVRGRIFTALLRAGKQTAAAADAEPERARRAVHALLAEMWAALKDERREALALAAAGRTRNAVTVLRQAGEWDEIARLHDREGRPAEAARLYEEHHADADAARCYKAAGDARSWVRCLLKAKDEAGLRAAVREVDLETAVTALLRANRRAQLDELLVERGAWAELAPLREKWRDLPGAAQAWEKADRPHNAIAVWRRAGREAEAVRLIDARIAPLLEKGDRVEAATALARWGLFERAADMMRAQRPDLAHRWLARGGLDEQALEFARHEARRAAGAERFGDAAEWLERAGEAAEAAEHWKHAGRQAKAAALYEQMGRWDEAAACWERAGQFDRALELYLRVGDSASAQRMEAAQKNRARTPA